MANALEAASLVMIPSGYEDGTLGSLKPTDGSGDFTFSRGSNLSATRINEQGYIEKGYENLLTYSNTFSDTAWSKTNGTIITGGENGYDGSNDAWLLNSTISTGQISQSIVSNVSTFSVYAKEGTNGWISLRAENPLARVWFDLRSSTTGSRIGYNTGTISPVIEDVGNGWFKCSISIISLTGVKIYSCQDNLAFGTGSIYIQDAMLNQGLVAYPYIETTTAPVAGGILEDMPRLDWSGSCPALLLEPSRTNLILYSEYIGGWSGAPTYTNTNTLNPEGRSVNSFYKRIVSQSINVDSNQTYSLSAYAKKDTWNWIYIRTAGFDAAEYTWFDLENGVVGNAAAGHGTPTITPEGNGWYRCTIYFSSITDLSGNAYLSGVPSNGSTTQGSNDQEAIFIDMIQCEKGSYPTSYIPTYGVSQTRLVDNVNRLDISSLATTYQTLFIEASVFSVGVDQYKFSLNDATGSRTNRFTIFINNDDLSLLVNAQGSSQPSITQNDYISANTTYKIAAVVRDGSYALFANGTKIGEQVGTTPSNLNSLTFGDAGNPLNQNWEGNVNQALVFPTALSDSECIALTTI